MRETLHLNWPFLSACISFMTLFFTSCEDLRHFGKKTEQSPEKTASFTGVSQWRKHFTDPKLQALTEQALNNTKEQFDNSPDLDKELEGAIIDALEAHSAMSKQALDSPALRADLKAVLLGAGRLWEGLRAKAASAAAAQ